MVHNILDMQITLLLISDSAEFLTPVLEQPQSWKEWWKKGTGERKTGGQDGVGNYEEDMGISGMRFGEVGGEGTRKLRP